MKRNTFGFAILQLFILASTLLIDHSAFAAAPFKDLAKFNDGTLGGNPLSGLITDGTNLYGTAYLSVHYTGVVFELTPPASGTGPWTETVLYTFTGGSDGSNPAASLLRDAKGNLYGTTSTGGNPACDGGCGTVFELSPPSKQGGNWTETTLYQFQGGNDGGHSQSSLIRDEEGNLYGATGDGGSEYTCCSTVFMLSRPSVRGGAWTESVLYDFPNGDPEPEPLAGLYRDPQGNLYGTTFFGGTGNSGTIFQVAPPSAGGSWTETIVYSFSGGTAGGYPADALISYKGSLYGTATQGGSGDNGTIFELTRQSDGTWSFNVLYAFTGMADGSSPYGGLAADTSGNLYGTTAFGGDNGSQYCQLSVHGCGAAFELFPPKNRAGAWTLQVLHAFGPLGGVHPFATLLLSQHALWGTTNGGGIFSSCPNYGCGTVFKIGL